MTVLSQMKINNISVDDSYILENFPLLSAMPKFMDPLAVAEPF